jgi:hypothetical protein
LPNLLVCGILAIRRCVMTPTTEETEPNQTFSLRLSGTIFFPGPTRRSGKRISFNRFRFCRADVANQKSESTAIFFFIPIASPVEVKPGLERLHIIISWPAPSSAKTSLSLYVAGIFKNQSDDGVVTVEVVSHQFRKVASARSIVAP